LDETNLISSISTLEIKQSTLQNTSSLSSEHFDEKDNPIKHDNVSFEYFSILF